MQRARAGEQRHRGRPVLPRAAEPVQQHERRAGPRLGAGHGAAGGVDAQRTESPRGLRGQATGRPARLRATVRKRPISARESATYSSS